MSSRSRKGRGSIRRKGSRRPLFKHLKDSTCKTGKRTYSTRLNALNALLVMQGLHKDDLSAAKDVKFTAVDVYKCPRCKLWLTHLNPAGKQHHKNKSGTPARIGINRR